MHHPGSARENRQVCADFKSPVMKSYTALPLHKNFKLFTKIYSFALGSIRPNYKNNCFAEKIFWIHVNRLREKYSALNSISSWGLRHPTSITVPNSLFNIEIWLDLFGAYLELIAFHSFKRSFHSSGLSRLFVSWIHVPPILKLVTLRFAFASMCWNGNKIYDQPKLIFMVFQ